MKSLLAANPQVQVGDKFERYEVIGVAFVVRTGTKKQRAKYVVCECECGTIRPVLVNGLLSGNSKSCDCLKIENSTKRLTKHGSTSEGKVPPIYHLWENMKKRCTRQHGKDYERYAGRGIIVHEEWKTDFAAFRDWALANGYEVGLQIDRINNDGNYEPSNCRFVTPEINSNNRKSNRLITAFGETKTLAQWARDTRCTVKYDCLKRRICKGWPTEAALTYPLNSGIRPVFG